MRLVSRAEFLSLPVGTIYCKVPERWYIDAPSVKDENSPHIGEDGSPIDWWYHELHQMTGDFRDATMCLKNRESVPLGDAVGRDGMFEREAEFLIFERDDLLKLRGYVDTALALIGG